MKTDKEQIIDAIDALVSIANGLPWKVYAESRSDTRLKVIERLANNAKGFVSKFANQDEDLLPYFTDLHWKILAGSANKYGTSIGSWEPDKVRIAQELVDQGFIDKELHMTYGRAYIYYITIKGLKALAWKQAVIT